MNEEARYRVEYQVRPGDPWVAYTFSDGITPISLPQDNAREEARYRKKAGRFNPNSPEFNTRIVLITGDEQAGKLARRQLVIHQGIALSDRAAEAFDAGDYDAALDMLKQARACALALKAPLVSDALDTFVSQRGLE